MEPMEAWLLPLNDTVSVALGRAELKYLEHLEQFDTLNRAAGEDDSSSEALPGYCRSSFLWRDLRIPLISLAHLANLPERTTENEQLVAIVAYQLEPDETLHLGALPLSAVPKLIQVIPEQAHPCSELAAPWRDFAHAAFQQNQTCYPVLDLQRVFAR